MNFKPVGSSWPVISEKGDCHFRMSKTNLPHPFYTANRTAIANGGHRRLWNQMNTINATHLYNTSRWNIVMGN